MINTLVSLQQLSVVNSARKHWFGDPQMKKYLDMQVKLSEVKDLRTDMLTLFQLSFNKSLKQAAGLTLMLNHTYQVISVWSQVPETLLS